MAFNSYNKLRPYVAQVKRGGKTVSLDSFATAEEAALCVARDAAAAATGHADEPALRVRPHTPTQADAAGILLAAMKDDSVHGGQYSWP